MCEQNSYGCYQSKQNYQNHEINSKKYYNTNDRGDLLHLG